MKNKGLIITLIILLTIIIFFLVMFLVAGIRGGEGFFMRIGSKEKKIFYDETFPLESINSIDIKQNAGDIIFKETESNHIQVVLQGERENDFIVNTNNNKLEISNANKNKFVLFSFGDVSNDIIIYMPSSYSSTIKVENDYGNCEMADFENATVDIDCDAGNVELGKIKNALVKCDCGNIEVKEILNKCDLKADCGNIEIDKTSIKENSTLKADLGNINVKETNDIYIEAEVDLGKKNISSNNRNSSVTLKIDCDCGNVNVG